MRKLVLLTTALFLYGCQKSDVEQCVDAHMEAHDERAMKEPVNKTPGLTRKEYRANMYQHCLALSARPAF
jgi:hypothetical protein